jgi:hypothetical protein
MIEPSGSCQARHEALITALREAFADRALEVARRQLELARADTAEVWERIVADLGG